MECSFNFIRKHWGNHPFKCAKTKIPRGSQYLYFGTLMSWNKIGKGKDQKHLRPRELKTWHILIMKLTAKLFDEWINNYQIGLITKPIFLVNNYRTDLFLLYLIILGPRSSLFANSLLQHIITEHLLYTSFCSVSVDPKMDR